jgi:hypothetical protein
MIRRGHRARRVADVVEGADAPTLRIVGGEFAARRNNLADSPARRAARVNWVDGRRCCFRAGPGAGSISALFNPSGIADPTTDAVLNLWVLIRAGVLAKQRTAARVPGPLLPDGPCFRTLAEAPR